LHAAWRTKELTGKRGRRASEGFELDSPSYSDISPVWEILPQDSDDTGVRRSIIHRDGRLRRGLGLTDVVAALAALVIASRAIGANPVTLQVTDLLVIPFVLFTGKVVGLYDRDQHLLRKTTIDEAPSIFYFSVVFALAVWLCEAVLFTGQLTRPQVLGLLLVTFCLTTVGRLLVRRIAFILTAAERCVVIGDESDTARIANKLHDSAGVNATVIGRVPLGHREDMSASGGGFASVLGDYADLRRLVTVHSVQRIIIAPQSDGQERILDAIRLVKALGVNVSVVPRLLEVVGTSSTFDEVDGIWLLGVRPFGMTRSSGMLKRGLDITVAGAAFLVLGPLFLMMTLAVKLDSRGSVFFQQPRVGRGGERFWMLKFRSMVPDAEALKADLQDRNEAQGGLFKIEGDPRITRVGKLLRRTSLDEMPQLINVLRGDMSLVGPRPLVPDEDALIEGWQRHRLAVRPGMTGLWQIFGASRIPMHEMVKIDYVYGASWSLWLDLRILLRTIAYVLNRRGQ
jgi:exopolysaccharide biosynthesis polyprenyl glycosylphosphotransferase